MNVIFKNCRTEILYFPGTGGFIDTIVELKYHIAIAGKCNS